MSDSMKTELLISGQRPEGLAAGQAPAELGAGTQPALGATHAENAALPFLGSGSEVGARTLEALRQAGMVDESNPAERGGGGENL